MFTYNFNEESFRVDGVVGVGAGALIALAFGMYLLLSEDSKFKKIYCRLYGITLLSYLLCMAGKVYFALYQNYPCFYKAISIIQFPWRFLSIAIVMTAFIMAIGFRKVQEGDTKAFKPRLIYGAIAALMIVVCVSQTTEMLARFSAVTSKLYAYDASTLSETTLEFNIKDSDIALASLEQEIIASAPEVVTEIINEKGLALTVQVNNPLSEEIILEIPRWCYNGYYCKTNDGRELPVVLGRNNKVIVEIPKNYNGMITVNYKEPILWRVAETISMLSLVVILVQLRKSENRNRK